MGSASPSSSAAVGTVPKLIPGAAAGAAAGALLPKLKLLLFVKLNPDALNPPVLLAGARGAPKAKGAGAAAGALVELGGPKVVAPPNEKGADLGAAEGAGKLVAEVVMVVVVAVEGGGIAAAPAAGGKAAAALPKEKEGAVVVGRAELELSLLEKELDSAELCIGLVGWIVADGWLLASADTASGASSAASLASSPAYFR